MHKSKKKSKESYKGKLRKEKRGEYNDRREPR